MPVTWELFNDLTMAFMTVDRQTRLVSYDRSLLVEPDVHEIALNGPAKGTSLIGRFLTRLNPQSDGCVYYTGSVTTDGYGQVVLASDYDPKTKKTLSKKMLAHRFAWLIANGPLPGFLELNHRCCSESDCKGGQNCPHRRCCNPAHLEVVTHAFNMKLSRGNHGWKGKLLNCGHVSFRRNLLLRRGGVQICRTCSSEAVAA